MPTNNASRPQRPNQIRFGEWYKTMVRRFTEDVGGVPPSWPWSCDVFAKLTVAPRFEEFDLVG
jgi:hypothetical protein